MKEKILDFINRRWSSTNAHWLDGNCYWFSLILKKRFPEVEIMYLPISGHFIVRYENIFFDWRGEIFPTEKALNFNALREKDPLWYKRLIRDCFD